MIDNIPYIIYPIIQEKREILAKKLASKGYDGSKIQKFFYEIFNIIDKKTNAIAKISKKMISNCSLETDFASATTEFLMSTGTMVRFKNNYKFPNKEEFKNIIVTYFNNYVRIYNEVSNILDSAINSNF